MISYMSTFRIFVLGTSGFFGLVVFGLSAHWLRTEVDRFDFEGLGLATGLLSTLTLPAMLIIGRIRKGAYSSMIVFELCWLTVLWVLWLSLGVVTAEWNPILFSLGCGRFRRQIDRTLCSEFHAIEGLSFVNWILLCSYTTILLVFTIICYSRGIIVWTASVDDATLFVSHKVDRPSELSAGNAGNIIGTDVLPAPPHYPYPPAVHPNQLIAPQSQASPVFVQQGGRHPQV